MEMDKANKKRSYDDALSALTDVLSAWERDLEAREEQLRKDRQEFNRDRHAAYGDAAPGDVLHLNIGGTSATVLRRTLMAIPGSMLASRFSGRWDDSIEKDEHGHFFIDQEYSLFRHVIKYLRNKSNGDERFAVSSPKLVADEREDFYRMVDYYGLTNGLYPVMTQRWEDERFCENDSKELEFSEWTTFAIVPKGHDRRIKTYEVTLETVQRVQIGWNLNGSVDGSRKEESIGTGDTSDSFALDLTRSSFLFKGGSSHVDGLEQTEGTVVRSENYGRDWYLNGNLVAPVSREKWRMTQVMCPCISLKGSLEVTAIILE